MLVMWALERTPRNAEYSRVWEEDLGRIMYKKKKKYDSKLWCGCEPWKGHHLMLEKPKGNLEVKYREITEN